MADSIPSWDDACRVTTPTLPLRSPEGNAPSVIGAGIGAEPPPVDRPFANASRDGRLPYSLPPSAGRWRPLRRLSLGVTEPAGWIMPVTGDRLVASGPEGWVLVGEAGILARGGATGAEVVLDPGWGVFYLPGHTGTIEARHLADGRLSFSLVPTFGKGVEPIFLSRSRRTLLAVSVERPIQGHSGRAGIEAAVDAFTLPDPVQVDGLGWVMGAARSRLLLPSARVHVAALGDSVLIAMPNEIVDLDFELTARRLFVGDFLPLFLATGVGPSLHLLAESAGRRYYWGIGPDGVRFVSVALPIGAGPVLAPPILAAEGGAAILLKDRVLGVNAGGRMAWQLTSDRGLGGLPVGATRSADGTLLLSAGGTVLAIDPAGHCRTLATATSRLTSAPMLDGQDRLWVASDDGLLAFAPEP